MVGGVDPTPPIPPPRASTLSTRGLNNSHDVTSWLNMPLSEPIPNVTPPAIGQEIAGENSGDVRQVNSPLLPHKESDVSILAPPTSESPPIYTDSEEEEDEWETKLISIQSSKSHSGNSKMMLQPNDSKGNSDSMKTVDTPFSSQENSPLHTSTIIRQQISGSSLSNHESDDIIVTGPTVQPVDPDYMNQEAIDDELSDVEDGGVQKRIIVSHRSESEKDDILGLMVQDHRDTDYMNQETIDEIDLNQDYINQESIDKVNDIPDYINQENIDKNALLELALEEEEAVWKNIEFINQNTIDRVQLQLEESKMAEYMNQEVIDATFVSQLDNGNFNLYDTDNECTEDELDDDDDTENGKIRSKEPLQIRGTSPIKSHTLKGASDSGKDYENQDVLDGDIIPMVIASMESETLPCFNLPTQTPMGHDGFVVRNGSEDTTLIVRDPPKTQAEMSSSNHNQTALYDTLSGFDSTRFPVCSNDQTSTSLDFNCSFQSNNSRPAKYEQDDLHLKKAQLTFVHTSSGSPILTKERSLTDIPGFESQSSASSQATTPGSNDVDANNQDPFHRDYIPVSLTEENIYSLFYFPFF